MEKRTLLEKFEVWFQVGFWGGNEKCWWDESLTLVHENTWYKMLLTYFKCQYNECSSPAAYNESIFKKSLKKVKL